MKEQMTLALEFALMAHGNQTYGDSDKPYAYHLLQVDRKVVEFYKPKNLSPSEPYSKHPGDEMDNLRAIAFLHDVLEDTDYTVDDVREYGFNEDVILACECITKRDGQSYEAYLDVVISNPLAHKVKLCDTAANLMNSLQDGSMKRIKKYVKQFHLLNEGF